jgi:hypothetical protein
VHALDSFASTILGFKHDEQILAIPISAQTPSAKSTDVSSAGPSVGSIQARAGKRKAVATPPPPKNLQKIMNKKASGLKINDPTPKPSSTPTPPKGHRGKFTVCRSNTYPHQESFFTLS